MRYSANSRYQFRSFVIVLCLIGIAVTGCTRPGETVNRIATIVLTEKTDVPVNIVLVSIDTLRADHLGSYGFPDGYTATIDRIAARGKLRNMTYTTIPHTTPGHASLLTGLYPVKHGSRDNADPVKPGIRTLAQVLQQHGYSTAGSVAHFLLSPESSGLDAGFEHYWTPHEPVVQPGENEEGAAVFPLVTNTYRPWKTVNGYAQSWLSTVSEPWFLFLHYYECHTPYEPGYPWNHMPGLHPYDGEIARVDRAVSDVLNMLVLTGWKDKAEIIITSDHGESLGEHGVFGHGFNLYFPSMLIPWITMGIPGDTGIQNGVFRIMDIMPTILADRKLPLSADFDGVPDTRILTVAYGESASLYPDEPQRRIRSVRMDHHTMICHRNENRKELYDLRIDPGETTSITRKYPDQTDRFAEMIETFAAGDTDTIVPPDEVLRPEVKDALEALGYAVCDREKPEIRE